MCVQAVKQGVKMSTKSIVEIGGFSLQDHALLRALVSFDPNPRSPAFAIQAISKLAQDAGLLNSKWDLKTCCADRLDALIRGKVSWNKRGCFWQLGKGTHVSFKNIARIAVRWYAHGWDFNRHTRDSEVRYPEDVEISPFGDEFKHLKGTLMPPKGELTRRIVTTPASEHFYYLDVIPSEDDLFIAEYGNFDDYKTHRRIGQPADFWSLETKTVLPMLRNAKVLSYRSHTNFSRMGRV